MYHWMRACWDLGIHSRNVELLWTPNRTLSSTNPFIGPGDGERERKKRSTKMLKFHHIWLWCVLSTAGFTVFCVPALTGRVAMLDVLSSRSPAKQGQKICCNFINSSLNEYRHQHSPAYIFSLGLYSVCYFYMKVQKKISISGSTIITFFVTVHRCNSCDYWKDKKIVEKKI